MDISQLYQLMGILGTGQTVGTYGSTGISGTGSLYGRYGTGSAVSSTFREAMQAAENKSSSSSISTPMDDIFEEASRKTGVDVNLLKAVGKAESNFNASATSHCGAMGVMQLMPATARGLGVKDAYDARENIMGGAKYLASLLKKYNGNEKLALAAYNAGPGNVDKYGGVPPFKETQNYVSRVLGYYKGGDISTGKTVEGTEVSSSAASGATEATSPAADSTASMDLNYTELCRLMVQMMQIQMQQKLQSILDFGDSDSSGGGISL